MKKKCILGFRNIQEKLENMLPCFLVNLHFIVLFSTLNFHFQSLCCRGLVDNLKAGGCTIHSRKCGADLGLFIKLSSCHLVILSGKHKGGFFPAPYVDR